MRSAVVSDPRHIPKKPAIKVLTARLEVAMPILGVGLHLALKVRSVGSRVQGFGFRI